MPGVVEAAWACGGDLRLYMFGVIEKKEKMKGECCEC